MNKKKKKFKLSSLLYLLALVAGVIFVMFLLNMADQYEVVVQNGTGGGKFKVGETVSVSIDESKGEFVQWELDYGGIDLDDLTSTTITFEMPEKNVGLTALFKETWTEKTGITYTGVRVGKANDGLGMIEYVGSAVFTNGDTYEGEWHNGKMSGEGLYSWVDENGKVVETYQGEFINDRVAGDGIGTYYDADGNVTEQYEGAYLSGERAGDGVGTLYANGVVVEKYDGEWTKDVIGGAGVYEWYDEAGTLVNKFEGTMTATAIDEEAHTYSYTFEGTYYTYDEEGKETSEEVTATKVPEEMKEVGLAQQ